VAHKLGGLLYRIPSGSREREKSLKAAILEEYHKPLVIKDKEIDDPGVHEVTVEVKACGLCMSDVHICKGKIQSVQLPHIPGHEIAGIIIKKGAAVDDFEIGHRVTVGLDVFCGRCDYCIKGETNRCDNLIRIGFERNGGYGEMVNVPAANLEKIADHLSFEKAAIIPDAVACSYRALKVIGEVRSGSRVAILGVGGLGMQAVQIAKLMGAQVIGTSRNDNKLERAESLGADIVINTKKDDFLEEVKKSVESLDVVIDNIGSRESVRDALAATRKGGKVVVMGYVTPELGVPGYDLVINEKQVLGCRASTRADLREAVRLVNSGRIDPDIEAVIPVREVNKALEDLEQSKFLTRSVLSFPF
jgi:propanol-preferring alcohol dehydrogenase